MTTGRKKKAVSPRVHKAASYMVKGSPWLKAPNAMGATLLFSPEEIQDPSLRRAIQRHRDHLVKEANKNTSKTIGQEDENELTSSAGGLSPHKKLKIIGGKSIRKTAPQAQQTRVNKHLQAENEKKALKEATIRYEKERTKKRSDRSKLGARRICDMINRKYGTNISPRTVEYYVRKGRINVSPRKRGNVGRVPHEIYKNFLVPAFRSFVQIVQNNGQGSRLMKHKLSDKVNTLVVMPGEIPSTTCKLLDRLLRDSGVNLAAVKQNPVEDRRRIWTAWAFINLWFDGWERTLVHLGFATRVDGVFHISDDQLARILNLDESGVSLDGSDGNKGGRPPVTICDPLLPMLGRCASKSSSTATIICGSSALGEALPPHLQLTTNAKSVDTMQVQSQMFAYLHNVYGKFGHSVRQKFPLTIGMNEKGGMDDVEFEKYIIDLIDMLYPDAEDKPGKRVMVKIDSGPGRTNAGMLARLRLRGVALYPGVPNTTSVTQETDQNYGDFKTAYRDNLERFAAERERQLKTSTANMGLIGLFIFGGEDPETGLIFKNAFNAAFSKEKCLHAWKKVGAAPLTRACLNDPKVRHMVGAADDDPLLARLRAIQLENDVAIYQLKSLGYPAEHLEEKLIEREQTVQEGLLTEPQSAENVKIVATAGKYGKRFLKTGGYNFTSDFGLQVLQFGNRKQEAKELEIEKKKRQKFEKQEDDARAVLAKNKDSNKLNGAELKKLLAWYKVPTKDMGKTVNQMKNKWLKILQDRVPEPTYQKWNEEDETKLAGLQSHEINMKETALGRLKTARNREWEASIASMNKEDGREYVKKLSRMVETGSRFVEDSFEESDRNGM